MYSYAFAKSVSKAEHTMASKETENGSENNLTITFPSNTSHTPLSTELLKQLN